MKALLLCIVVLGLVTSSYQGVCGFGACVVFCCTVGPFKFAALVGMALDVAGCTPMCMVATAAGWVVPGVCFDEETMVMRINVDRTEELVRIADVRPGDYLMTSDWKTGNTYQTLVKSNMVHQGDQTFMRIQLSEDPASKTSDQYLEVTENHVMMIREAELLETRQAKEIKKGDLMATIHGFKTVSSISKSIKTSRVQLETDSGTILANGVLTTSYCEGQNKV